jgi:hypothetical protein
VGPARQVRRAQRRPARRRGHRDRQRGRALQRLYTIKPRTDSVTHYAYSEPLPDNGGYSVALNPRTRVARVSPLYYDEAPAAQANGPEQARRSTSP